MNQLISEPIVNEPLPIKVENEASPLPIKDIGHLKLLAALYWCYDAFGRIPMLFFPCFETGKQVKEQKELSGDHLDIGVRDVEWKSGGKTVLDAFIDQNRIPEKTTDNTVTYEYEGVPVVVHIFKDDICLRQCDTVIYNVEDFKLPNPYERFVKLYESA